MSPEIARPVLPAPAPIPSHAVRTTVRPPAPVPDLDPVRYPIGVFALPEPVTAAHRAGWTRALADLPARLRQSVAGLDDAQLDTPYREGGWTVRQVVHHVADAHQNLSIRFRLALTEDGPTVRPFDENTWAELPDARTFPTEASLAVVDGLHARLAALLGTLGEAEWARTFYHPVQQKHLRLDEIAGRYAWHGDHHAAQIEALRGRMGW